MLTHAGRFVRRGLAVWLLLALPVMSAWASCRDDVPWASVAPGVWAWSTTLDAEISIANAGHVVPTTLVVHGREALLIDPGPSHRHGLRVRRSVACRFGAQVKTIVNTHAHAENVLANSAFADLLAKGRLSIAASAVTRAGMAQRCPDCLASLEHKVGEVAMAATRIVLPTRTLREGETLVVGPYHLRVMRVEQGHTEGDLVLWDAQRRLLWVGGLVYGERLPELAQGRLDGWLRALDHLADMRPTVVLGNTVSRAPDAGRLPPALVSTRAYLADLRQHVLDAMDQGVQAHEAGRLELPAYASWAGYAERQGFNAQRAWRELEPVWMERGPAAPSVPQDVRR